MFRDIEWRFLIAFVVVVSLAIISVIELPEQTVAEESAAGGNLSVHPGQTVYYECNGGHYIISCEE